MVLTFSIKELLSYSYNTYQCTMIQAPSSSGTKDKMNPPLSSNDGIPEVLSFTLTWHVGDYVQFSSIQFHCHMS
jgi:hypothetical protein